MRTLVTNMELEQVGEGLIRKYIGRKRPPPRCVDMEGFISDFLRLPIVYASIAEEDRDKIELAAQQYPAAFIAFDCLYYDGWELAMLPLVERREYLRKAVMEESDRLAVSRVYEAEQAMELIRLTQEQGLEGLVAKKKNSLYFFGKRTKNWLKIKNLMDDDFVVCWYIRKKSNMSSIIIGQYEDHVLSYKGHVTLGVGGAPFAKIKDQPRRPWPPFSDPVPSGNEKAVWLEPRLVCTVEFMHRTKNGGMRQPVFKGLRDDKAPTDCVAWGG